jgi:predicted kinase
MSTNRPVLVICRGLQASGKTTWAHAWVAEDRKNRARVNRDDLREMIDQSIYVEGITEGRIVAARDTVIEKMLQRGISVVSDDTNLSSRNVRDLARLAVNGGYEWQVKDFSEVTLDECIRRNTLRPGSLHNDIIVDTYNRFLKGKPLPLPLPTAEQLCQVDPVGWGERYVPDISTPWAVIIDIDGTIALKGTRSPFDESRVHEDVPNWPVINVILADIIHHNLYPVFCSGRTAACRLATEDWINKHLGLTRYALHMREVGDRRVDWKVKLEIFDKYIRHNYHVLRVFDDRDQVVSMWRSIGLTCLQVASGAF